MLVSLYILGQIWFAHEMILTLRILSFSYCKAMFLYIVSRELPRRLDVGFSLSY
jgi:hypothetical protein